MAGAAATSSTAVRPTRRGATGCSIWTRRGLGTRILEACEAAARDEGFRRLSLGATLPGYALYARFGFVEVDRGTITLPDGTVVEYITMEMPIDPSTI